MFPIQSGIFPQELGLFVMSNLDPEDLETVRCVCKEWNRLEGLDMLWGALFIRTFKENAPVGVPAKVSFFKKYGLPVANMRDLSRIRTIFICSMDWNKKKRMEVKFPTTPPYSMIFEHGMGPIRGTEKGFQCPADEVSYYRYVGALPADFNPVEKAREYDYNMDGIPLRRTCIGDMFGYGPRSFIGEIQGVDVGYGNTLGYFSSVNNWKTPFRLFCISDGTGAHKWKGHIPFGEFKFVKMGSDGSIAWECYIAPDANRFWIARSSHGCPHSWQRYLEEFPIRFPQ